MAARVTALQEAAGLPAGSLLGGRGVRARPAIRVAQFPRQAGGAPDDRGRRRPASPVVAEALDRYHHRQARPARRRWSRTPGRRRRTCRACAPRCRRPLPSARTVSRAPRVRRSGSVMLSRRAGRALGDGFAPAALRSEGHEELAVDVGQPAHDHARRVVRPERAAACRPCGRSSRPDRSRRRGPRSRWSSSASAWMNGSARRTSAECVWVR